MVTGSCLCKGVSFEVTGPMRQAWACHCSQCRKQSGHFWASTNVDKADFRLMSDATLGWYNASPIARRGFCAACGSFLFWDEDGTDGISISLGSLDAPTGLQLERHIFTADKGDYYDITDDLPQRAD